MSRILEEVAGKVVVLGVCGMEKKVIIQAVVLGWANFQCWLFGSTN